MKKTIVAMICFAGVSVLNAVTITNFGVGPTATGSWTYSNGAYGGASDAGNFLFETLGGPVDIFGQSFVQIDLTPNTVTAGTSFIFNFKESAGGANVASATFSAAQLNSGSAQSTLVDLGGGGDLSNVNFWIMSASGASGDTFDVTLSQLSAVPEPSTYAALAGLCALGYVMVRRRRA